VRRDGKLIFAKKLAKHSEKAYVAIKTYHIVEKLHPKS
jgi:hypothetical protein